MPAIQLKIDDLVLDNDNPRITHAEGQQQTLQKVVKDQKTKLVRLAESIVEHGLSPIERFMVMEVSRKPRRYIALEGNRRVAALRLLTNPAVMTGLDMPNGMQRSMERLAKVFDRSQVEPIDGHEVGSREEGRYWIELRHNGEDQGRGVVGWKPIVAARFRKWKLGSDPYSGNWGQTPILPILPLFCRLERRGPISRGGPVKSACGLRSDGREHLGNAGHLSAITPNEASSRSSA